VNQRLSLGRWFGLALTISPLALIMYLALAPLSMLASILLFRLDAPAAAWSGAVVSAGLFVSDWLHQWGHALAAKWTGHPMSGIHFYSLFSNSQYPPDEPALPPGIHIRRALGGFWINLLIGLLLGAAASSLGPAGGGLGWATSALAFLNFVVLGLGALLPLEIKGLASTDGAVILRNLRQPRPAR
jgi:hypothetical protein